MTILDRISVESSIPLSLLSLVARTADHRYKVYTIPKVSGGERVIQHPAREVKFLQRWVVSNIFQHAPIHPTAMAYRPGRNVRDNALRHAQSRFFLKLDFEDFFPSIRSHDVMTILAQISSTLPFALTTDDPNIVVKIVTRYGQLPIGAPSSPAISNCVMYGFDDAMSQLARQYSCIYSRYADDIVFSTNVPYVLGEVLREVRQYLAVHTVPALRINEGKVVFNSKKRRVRITGLVISCHNSPSVGRSEKRKIKALAHRFSTSQLDAEMATYLKGYLGYVKSVDPMFVNTLEKKYGKSVIDAIFAATTARRKI
jgi:RNA-directed DNA polymerase